MYILLVGGTTLAYNLAKDLLSRSYEVLVVERDRRRWAELTQDLGDVVLRGDGCDVTVLETAGANRADTLIATTRHDRDNLTACQIAKARFRVPRTIATINDPRNESLFKSLGVDVTVSVTGIMLSHIEQQIPEEAAVSLLDIGATGSKLISVTVPGEPDQAGMKIEDIRLPQGSFISLVINSEGVPQDPTPELELHGDDTVIAVTAGEGEKSLITALYGDSSSGGQ